MPSPRSRITFALLLAGACSPAQFAWDDARTRHLVAYRESFAAAAGEGFDQILTRPELRQRLRQERILWLGDHHRSSRLHALQSELLSQLQQDGVRMVLLLEAIGQQDEPDVQKFLRGEIEQEGLRAAMRSRWSGSWLDDRELDPWHYRSLLTFARRHKLPVGSLEPVPRLAIQHRDPILAESVRAAAITYPDHLLVVHVGQAHLLGLGDLVARTGLGGLVLGGEPPSTLRAAATTAAERGSVVRSEGGLWWFAELLRDPD